MTPAPIGPPPDLGAEERTAAGLIVPEGAADEAGVAETIAYIFAPVSIMVKPDEGAEPVFVAGLRLLHVDEPPFPIDGEGVGRGKDLRAACAACADALEMPTTPGQRKAFYEAVARLWKAIAK